MAERPGRAAAASGAMGKPVREKSSFIGVFAIGLLMVMSAMPAAAETEVRTNMELNNSVYRGKDDSWYYTGNGKADIRLGSIGNTNMRAEAAIEFYPVDLSGGSSVTSTPAITLKRLWLKSNFPAWRLTLGKTKVAWGNGYVFNSGDVLFGSLGPYVDFTSSTIRDDTAWLTAVNLPLGRFSYLEAVVLPPSIDFDGSSLEIQTANHTSGGLRFFGRAGGWRLEGGYLYKGDAKTALDVLGHRPYFSVHGHAGVDLYASVSLAAGWDSQAGVNRDTWEEVSRTVNLSIGAYHQIQAGYESTLTMRLEGLLLPWQNWNPQKYQELLDGTAGYYGLLLYPELNLAVGSVWFAGIQSVVSPVDASAQITTSIGWNVFQGFTLIGYVVVNVGNDESLFAWDRSGNWPEYPPGSPSAGDPLASSEFNGVNITLGARYSF